MKLLLDQNLSPKLVKRLADLLPNSSEAQPEGGLMKTKEGVHP